MSAALSCQVICALHAAIQCHGTCTCSNVVHRLGGCCRDMTAHWLWVQLPVHWVEPPTQQHSMLLIQCVGQRPHSGKPLVHTLCSWQFEGASVESACSNKSWVTHTLQFMCTVQQSLFMCTVQQNSIRQDTTALKVPGRSLRSDEKGYVLDGMAVAC